jgi:hypothetical protein
MSLQLKLMWLFLMALGVAGNAAAQLSLHSSDGIRYASGGIGGGERDELELMLPDYNLKLVVAAQGSGAFLADVKLTAVDARGAKVLETTLDGPWFVGRFPPGRYELQLAYGGAMQKRLVTIPAQGRRVEYVYWTDASATTLKSIEQAEKPTPSVAK